MADVDVKFGAQVAEALQGAKQVSDSIKGVAETVSGLTGVFTHVAEGIAAAFSVEKIAEFVKRMEELGVQTQRTMAILGVSAGTAETLTIAAHATGGSADALTFAMSRLSAALIRADAGSLQVTAALKALNLSAKDLQSLNTEDKLKLIADRFSVVKDGADKTAIAIALFGRSGANMIPFLNEGAEGLKKFGDMMQRAGSAPTEEFLARAHELHLQTVELDESFKGLGMTLLEAFGGPLAGVQQWFIDLIQSMRQSIQEGGALGVVVDGLAFTFKVLASALVIVTSSVQILWELVKVAVFAIGEGFIQAGIAISGSLGAAIKNAGQLFQDLVEIVVVVVKAIGNNFVDLGLLIVAALRGQIGIAMELFNKLRESATADAAAIGAAFVKLGGDVGNAMKNSGADWSKAWDNYSQGLAARSKMALDATEKSLQNATNAMEKIWSTHADHVDKINQTTNARMAMANKDAVAAALAAGQERIRLADMEYKSAEANANHLVKMDQITESQKTSILLAALETRHAAEMAAIDDMLKIQGLSLAQYQKLLNDKLTLDAKYAADRTKIMNQAAEDEWKKWKGAADDIAGAWNSQIRGLLSGTQTFSQAIGQMLGNLIVKWLGDLSKLAIEWAAKQLFMLVTGRAFQTADLAGHAATETAKTAATGAGVAARTGAEATGAAAQGATGILGAFQFIFAQAGKAFAGVFAFLSPAMGPAAAGPAAASEAEVITVGTAGIGAFDKGTDYVMKSGLAIIHEGEKIVPAQAQTPYTGGRNGGGAQMSVTIPVTAWDAHSVQRWLSSGGSAMLAKSLASYMNLNPSARPSY